MLQHGGPDPALAVTRARTAELPGWPPTARPEPDPNGLLEAAVRQWFEVHVRQPPRRWPLGLPSRAVRQAWVSMAAHPGYEPFCLELYGRLLPVAEDATRMPRTWEAACHAERVDARRPSHLPVIFLVDQTLHVPGGSRYTSQCTGRVCRVEPPEVCVRHAFAPPRFFSYARDDSTVTRPH